ncbi:hypothetical protein AB0M05_20115 [Streptomyces violaceusniger]|uniref:hypothetical protein n=1 Tax=Streptomyces violaceusniger TaxID=68280 RepID=UPI00344581FA
MPSRSTARAHPADVTDDKALTGVLHTAAEELGRIGVLACGPATTFPNVAGQVPDLKALGRTAAAETTPPSVRPLFDMLVGGAPHRGRRRPAGHAPGTRRRPAVHHRHHRHPPHPGNE